MTRFMKLLGAVLVVGSLSASSGCEKKPGTPTGGKPTGASATGAKHDDHDHAEGDGHDHADAAKHADHGAVVELGSNAIGAFQVKASRDGGVKAGKESPVDLWVTPGAGVKVAAVRAWIGTQDAKGSIKAKMELEKENYHNHVEVPEPLPPGSKLWVEIEDDKGVKAVGSFDLKG